MPMPEKSKLKIKTEKKNKTNKEKIKIQQKPTPNPTQLPMPQCPKDLRVTFPSEEEDIADDLVLEELEFEDFSDLDDP